jgi:hypothetical protein
MTMMGWRPGDDAPPFLLSSYVCTSLFNRQNSQILRRPQDDRKSGGPSSKCTSGWLFYNVNRPFNVILCL